MKYLLLITSMLLVSFTTFAQFEKGNKVLGLGLNFNSSNNEQAANNFTQITKQTVIGLNTEIGFAKTQNQLHGFFVSGSFGRQRNESLSQPTSISKQDQYNIGAGYFMRRYKSLGKNFFVFGDGRAGFGYGEQNVGATSFNNQKQYSINAGIYPGIAYKWNRSFLLELRFADLVSVGYTHVETRNGVNNAKNVNKNFGIGVRWILGSNKKS
jgi:hypothetical protein